MPRENINNMMGRYGPEDYTVKLLSAIFSVLPMAPKFEWYRNMDEAVKFVAPTATPEQMQKGRDYLMGEDFSEGLWVLDALDTGDKGIAMYTGLKSAFNLFFSSSKENPNRFESDPQQATDAALKALGISYAIAKFFPGSIPEKIAMFNRLAAGQQMLMYYAAMEVALPFTDNVLHSGGNAISQLMDKSGKDSSAKMLTLVGQAAATEATGVFGQLKGQLEDISSKVVQFVGPMAEKAKAAIPGALVSADKITSVVSTGADVLPVWGLLGCRLAIEAALYRSVRGQ